MCLFAAKLQIIRCSFASIKSNSQKEFRTNFILNFKVVMQQSGKHIKTSTLSNNVTWLYTLTFFLSLASGFSCGEGTCYSIMSLSNNITNNHFLKVSVKRCMVQLSTEPALRITLHHFLQYHPHLAEAHIFQIPSAQYHHSMK